MEEPTAVQGFAGLAERLNTNTKKVCGRAGLLKMPGHSWERAGSLGFCPIPHPSCSGTELGGVSSLS